MKPLRVGIVGAGNISTIYCENLSKFPSIDLVGIADINPVPAVAQAEKFGIKQFEVDELIEGNDVDLVLNITIPKAHGEVGLRVLESGKHVYNEKPLAISRDEARAMLKLAEAKGLHVGCAPDTFLGAGHQKVRELIDSGVIGTVVGAQGWMVSRGVESWHPNPDFFYKPGAGPMLDMGPYYLTAMVNLFGSINRVASLTRTTFAEREIKSEPLKGGVIKVETPTHFSSSYEFASGVIGQLTMSFDSHGFSGAPNIVVYGSEGTIVVPDPNSFNGWDHTPSSGYISVRPNSDEGKKYIVQSDLPFKTNSRGLGILDIAHAVNEGRSSRASGALSFHVLDAMLASIESSDQGKFIELETKPERPSVIGAAEFPDERILMG
jgi:predicted dehydrogenase